MLVKWLGERKAEYERRIRDLHYEKGQLQARVAEVEQALWNLGGALAEVDRVLHDLKTEAELRAAQEKLGEDPLYELAGLTTDPATGEPTLVTQRVDTSHPEQQLED